jgi:hypothetical protein
MAKDEDPLTIYWSPFGGGDYPVIREWNMMYPEPTNVFSDLMRIKNLKSKDNSFMSCPAAVGRLKNMFVFKNGMNSEYEFDNTDPQNPWVRLTSKTGIAVKYTRQSAWNNGASLDFSMQHIFFAEEPVNAVFSPPFMHQAEYIKYATCVPATYDISKWFRPFVFEIQTWNPSGKLVLPEGDPLFYIEVFTDRKIVLKRFVLTQALQDYGQSCIKAKNQYDTHLPLVELYQKFTNSRMNDLILKEIKSNLL